MDVAALQPTFAPCPFVDLADVHPAAKNRHFGLCRNTDALVASRTRRIPPFARNLHVEIRDTLPYAPDSESPMLVEAHFLALFENADGTGAPHPNLHSSLDDNDPRARIFRALFQKRHFIPHRCLPQIKPEWPRAP